MLFLLTSIGLGLLVVGGVKAIAGKQFKVTPTSFVLVLLIPLITGTGLMAVGSFLEVHEAPELCGEYCHAMGPVHDTYLAPGNNTLLGGHESRGVTCLDCHTGPGWRGQIDIWLSVPNEAWKEVWGTYDPEHLGERVHPLFCLKCHDGTVGPVPGAVTTAINTTVDPHGADQHCGDCHTAHDGGMGMTPEACAICHGTQLDKFALDLERHGNRTQLDCMDCHDRQHPEDAQVPFAAFAGHINAEFCSDCHLEQYEALNKSLSPLAHELYGECTRCHERHEPSVPIHEMEPPFDECSKCHKDMARLGGIHNRAKITYLGVGNITNGFCQACHAKEVAGLMDNSVHRTLECVSCHSDHRLRVVFDTCLRCHDEQLPEWHVPDTIGCNWSYCHGTEFYH